MGSAAQPDEQDVLLSLMSLARQPVADAEEADAPPVADSALLRRAYEHCGGVARAHSRSFYLASGFLPAEKQRAIRALYAFCRVSDSLVDCRDADCAQRLAAWRRLAMSQAADAGDLVAVAWTDARARYRVPRLYAQQLLDGVERDLHQKRYANFADLAVYAYGVASTVGLMSMHIIGFAGPQAIPYAVKLGLAMQLINILRDVREDWQAGRLYLPADELARYRLTEEDIARGRVDDRWRAFMRFQVARARQLYRQAWPGVAMLDADGRLAVAAAAEFYSGILDDIESHGYDVFRRRAYVSNWGKIRRLPGIWWRSR